jgi:hypothetical protein
MRTGYSNSDSMRYSEHGDNSLTMYFTYYNTIQMMITTMFEFTIGEDYLNAVRVLEQIYIYVQPQFIKAKNEEWCNNFKKELRDVKMVMIQASPYIKLTNDGGRQLDFTIKNKYNSFTNDDVMKTKQTVVENYLDNINKFEDLKEALFIEMQKANLLVPKSTDPSTSLSRGGY